MPKTTVKVEYKDCYRISASLLGDLVRSAIIFKVKLVKFLKIPAGL